MSMVQTSSGEIGTELASAIREAMSRALGAAPVATYIEEQTAPVSWRTIADAGWDLAGLVDDAEPPEGSASLRDLAEIGRAWGEHLLQLPLMPSLIAKRHSAPAAAHDGPVSFSIATRTTTDGHGVVPFGRVDGVRVVADFGSPADLLPVVGDATDDFAPSLRCAVQPHVSVLTPVVAREIAVVCAAEASGVASRLLRDAVAFSKERRQFGRPIGSFQAIKHQMADAHIAAEFAETGAIWASLEPDSAARAVVQSFRDSQRSLHRSIQIYGGLGFTWEMGLHFALKHVSTLRELAEGALAAGGATSPSFDA